MLNETTALHQRPSPAKTRVIDAAAALFRERGYQAVSMRDVAQALDMKQASLYYHVPQGKEQLFVEVTARRLATHQAGLQTAIATADPHLQAQLHAIAHWVFSQPPLHLYTMAGSDMPQLSDENAAYLMRLTHQALFAPLAELFATAVANGTIRQIDPNQMAGCFLSLLEGIIFANEQSFFTGPTPQQSADTLIDVLLHGLLTDSAHSEEPQ